MSGTSVLPGVAWYLSCVLLHLALSAACAALRFVSRILLLKASPRGVNLEIEDSRRKANPSTVKLGVAVPRVGL